jgi:hypothetical protein
MPVHNAASTPPVWELVAVDDGSTA